MQLRNKVSIILVTIWLAVIVIAFAGSKLILDDSYLHLETKQANDSLQRVHEALQQATQTVSTLTANWAIWDDTYKFVVDKNKAYIKTNLVVSSFLSADIDMMVFLNQTSKPIYSMAVNAERSHEIPVPQTLFNYITPGSKLANQPNIGNSTQGLLSLPSGILLIAAHAVVTSNNQGPVQGTIIMAKYLSPKIIEKIKDVTKLDIAIIPFSKIGMDLPLSKAKDTLLRTNEFLIINNNAYNMTGYSLLKDINNQPIAIIKAIMPRTIYQFGLKTLTYYDAAFFIYSIIITFVLWLLLQKLLVRRLERLKTHIGDLHTHPDTFNNLTDGIADEVSSVASLYHQATHDPLTELANRNLLDQVFKNHVANQSQHSALLYLDIDHFKRINDTLGHEIGDLLLITIAKRLTACLRDRDLAVRLGGDEFLVLLVDIEIEQVKDVIKRINHSLSQIMFIQHHELRITSSMGVSLYPKNGTDIASLLKTADIALYHAKECGRNNYQYYSNELNSAILEAHKKEAELQQAVDKNEFCLFYQPIFDVLTKKIISIEALIRWNHPTRGLLSPAEIIPLAERSGLIVPIGEWVLSAACAKAKTWIDQGYDMPTISVNFSVLQAKDISMAQLVANALTRSGLDPHLLELELTETSYVEVTDAILQDMHKLKELGVQLAVDDFGVGSSGLGYLRSLPVSKLKIDRSFIQNIFNRPDDRAITLAVIAIAHQLELRVVAEGVETSEQFNFLKLNNVDAVQGNYLCPPIDESKFDELLRTTKTNATQPS